MIEARIMCVCTQIDIPDLELSMRKGDVRWRSEKEARKSKDLQRAKRAKGVIVHYIRRAREERPKVPEVVKRPRRDKPGVIRGKRPTTPPPTKPPPAQHTPTTALVATDDKARREVQQLKAELPGMLRDALQGFVGVHTTPGVIPPEQQAPADEPVFVPETVKGDDIKGTVKTEKATSEAAGVDDAAAALKKTRKRKKKAAPKGKSDGGKKR